MNLFRKIIFTGFSPNLLREDVLISLRYLCLPWNWKKIKNGENREKVEEKMEKYFSVKQCTTFDSGRWALYFALKALDIKENEEVLLQAYTCVVVSNAVIWSGAKPIYVDIKENFNMDLEDLQKKITPRSRVLIIQHTFGRPAQMQELLEIARKNNLKIIEDCAHTFGAKYAGKKLGTFGDIGMFSFGSDKPLSAVRGGALITNDVQLGEKIKNFQKNLSSGSLGEILRHLWHSPIFFVSKPLYGIGIGKFFLFLFGKLGIINKIIYPSEKRGEKTNFFPAKFSNALAEILLKKMDETENINAKRQALAKIYAEGINNAKIKMPETLEKDFFYLRYPLIAEEPQALFAFAKEKGIILGNWYNAPIAPADIDEKKTGYIQGSCPQAERLAKKSVNLPTDINLNEEDAKGIVKVLNAY